MILVLTFTFAKGGFLNESATQEVIWFCYFHNLYMQSGLCKKYPSGGMFDF